MCFTVPYHSYFIINTGKKLNAKTVTFCEAWTFSQIIYRNPNKGQVTPRQQPQPCLYLAQHKCARYLCYFADMHMISGGLKQQKQDLIFHEWSACDNGRACKAAPL